MSSFFSAAPTVQRTNYVLESASNSFDLFVGCKLICNKSVGPGLKMFFFFKCFLL